MNFEIDFKEVEGIMKEWFARDKFDPSWVQNYDGGERHLNFITSDGTVITNYSPLGWGHSAERGEFPHLEVVLWTIVKYIQSKPVEYEDFLTSYFLTTTPIVKDKFHYKPKMELRTLTEVYNSPVPLREITDKILMKMCMKEYGQYDDKNLDLMGVIMEKTGLVRVHIVDCRYERTPERPARLRGKMELNISGHNPLTRPQRIMLLDIIRSGDLSPDQIFIDDFSYGATTDIIRKQLRQHSIVSQFHTSNSDEGYL
jgi:hypothetical protein|tara:strand:- start:1650 stop:2417 length:768 start_codon:yes stop_codon:yes gene_type:complete